MDEQYTESRLREELRHAVDHVQVPSDMWARIRRRHRREPRQRMLAVATSMALLAIVVAAAFPVVRDAAERAAGPIGGTNPEVVTTDPEVVTDGPMEILEGEDELAPMPGPPTGPVPVLATGEIDGHRWMFTVYERTDVGGRLVWGFPQPDRDTIGGGWASGSLNPLRDDPLAPSVQIDIGTSMEKPSFVYGPVVKDAAVVRVQTPDGEIREVPTVGQDAGFASNFYAAPIPTGVSVNGVRVTAHDANGRQVGQAWSPQASPTPGHEHAATTTTTPPAEMILPGEPVPPGDELSMAFHPATQPGVLLTSNYLDNREWMLVFFERDGMVCLGWLHGAGGGCNGETGTAEPLNGSAVRISGLGGGAEGSHLYGAVAKEVTRVRLALPDAGGRVIDLYPVGQGLGLDVNFFGTALRGGTSFKGARVAAYDRAGQQLGSDTAPG